MKFLRAAFSLIASVTATVFGPIWSHPRTLRAISNVLLLIALLSTCAWLLFWLGQKPVFTLNHLTVESLDGRELKHVNLPTIKARALIKCAAISLLCVWIKRVKLLKVCLG